MTDPREAALLAQPSLEGELRDLVRRWGARSNDPGLNTGARSGFFFASCALEEVLRRYGIVTDEAGEQRG